MNAETRVGFMATSVLEDIARENIDKAYQSKDYKTLTQYISIYIALHDYNKEK